jgi:hypothetical protein
MCIFHIREDKERAFLKFICLPDILRGIQGLHMRLPDIPMLQRERMRTERTEEVKWKEMMKVYL